MRLTSTDFKRAHLGRLLGPPVAIVETLTSPVNVSKIVTLASVTASATLAPASGFGTE
ncbi:hypothetical protein GCM10028802_26270 [Terrabacter terrigena]